MWFIGVELEQETSAPPPKKNPGSAPEKTAAYAFKSHSRPVLPYPPPRLTITELLFYVFFYVYC